MRPETGDLTLFGLGSHVHDEVVDPDRYNENADPDRVLENAELLARRIPAMEAGRARGGYAGVYDTTPDGQPVLGAIPEREQRLLAPEARPLGGDSHDLIGREALRRGFVVDSGSSYLGGRPPKQVRRRNRGRANT